MLRKNWLVIFGFVFLLSSLTMVSCKQRLRSPTRLASGGAAGDCEEKLRGQIPNKKSSDPKEIKKRAEVNGFLFSRRNSQTVGDLAYLLWLAGELDISYKELINKLDLTLDGDVDRQKRAEVVAELKSGRRNIDGQQFPEQMMAEAIIKDYAENYRANPDSMEEIETMDRRIDTYRPNGKETNTDPEAMEKLKSLEEVADLRIKAAEMAQVSPETKADIILQKAKVLGAQVEAGAQFDAVLGQIRALSDQASNMGGGIGEGIQAEYTVTKRLAEIAAGFALAEKPEERRAVEGLAKEVGSNEVMISDLFVGELIRRADIAVKYNPGILPELGSVMSSVTLSDAIDPKLKSDLEDLKAQSRNSVNLPENEKESLRQRFQQVYDSYAKEMERIYRAKERIK